MENFNKMNDKFEVRCTLCGGDSIPLLGEFGWDAENQKWWHEIYTFPETPKEGVQDDQYTGNCGGSDHKYCGNTEAEWVKVGSARHKELTTLFQTMYSIHAIDIQNQKRRRHPFALLVLSH